MEKAQNGNKAGEASLTSNSDMWINSLGSYSKYKKTSESPAFRKKMWGFMLGLEYRINDSLRSGVAGAFTRYCSNCLWQKQIINPTSKKRKK
jgi:outer membrane autotransporter protein